MEALETLKETFSRVPETTENPKMVEIFVNGKTYQNAFCFAMVVAPGNHSKKMLSCIIAGADSTLQSMKAAIDLGTHGFSFGYGEKGLHSYKFIKEISLFTEKGEYNYFPITVNNKKAYAIVHNEVLDGKYIMSFEENPAQDVRAVLGGREYGLPLLEEWSNTILKELKDRAYIKDVPMYYDPQLFPNGFHFMEIGMSEEEGDQLLSEMIAKKQLEFPSEGTGDSLEEVDDLTTYMTSYSEEMLEKISAYLTPTHNPISDPIYDYFDEYETKLFPVQGHVATGIAKRLQKQKSIILQGEMSTGKSKLMTAIADAYAKMKGKKGFHAVIMVPPSLTDKWSNEEIYDLLPNPRSKVIYISSTKELIQYHQAWVNQGKPKPEVPTFFVISFTIMRSDSAIEPAVYFEYKKTKKQKTDERLPYRFGYYCSDCGSPHQVIEARITMIDENGEEKEQLTKKTMDEDEFGTSRRIDNHTKPANAFCSECGGSLWTKKVPNRYRSFKEWAEYEKKLAQAIRNGDRFEISRLNKNQPKIEKKTGSPRRVAAIEYIRRKMKKFFDVAIIDEVHELKGGGTAQGNALGSLAAASKRVVAGTGTLFGGKAADIYYLLWRMFPYEMVKAGYKYSDITRWNHEFGNVEKTTYSRGNDDSTEYTNKQSRGGLKAPNEKVLPGISPFVFGRFLLQNTVLVRLLDVWPDPVELVDVPTILVDMDKKMKCEYQDMCREFERLIDKHKGKDSNFSNLWLLYTETGIAYPDNPFHYPEVLAKGKDGLKHHLWSPSEYRDETETTPKEDKLIEITRGELEEKRPMIVYVRDTGSSNPSRDIQVRLKKVLEENIEGCKVAILRSNTTKTDQRSHWVKKKIEKEGCNVIIVSMQLVKVGLDLLCTPTLLFYQFNWSMFTMAQAAKRAFRIGQTKECRLFYLAYRDSFQENMAFLIAQKNKASSAINGEVSGEGLSAMLGEDGDLQTMLIKSIKKGEKLTGSSEEWVSTTTDRAREILSGIGKAKKELAPDLFIQLLNWAKNKQLTELTINTLQNNQNHILERIQTNKVSGFTICNDVLSIDEILAFGIDYFADGDLINHLMGKVQKPTGFKNINIRIIEEDSAGKKKRGFVEGQLALDLFA